MHRLRSGSIPPVAAGADFTFRPSGSEWSKVVALRATLTTSATVASRVPVFQILQQDGTVVFDRAATTAQAASTIDVYDLSQTLPSDANNGSAANGFSALVLPDFWLPSGWAIRSLTTAIQTTDQWSALSFAAILADDIFSGAYMAEYVMLANQ